MGKSKKRKLAASASKRQADTGKSQAGTQGLNIWVWMFIGAGAGLIVWAALRFIVPMLGGGQ
ncbi:MAG: hypothetical protein KGZ66_10165 [Selenomonadales bacterium]|jgi:hypothetical protein|nr:hypothetical protein [Selenomonadales bacterium]